MVSSTLCPAVHILGSQNVYSAAEGIADHYWPWAVFCLFVRLLDLLSICPFFFPMSFPQSLRLSLCPFFRVILCVYYMSDLMNETINNNHINRSIQMLYGDDNAYTEVIGILYFIHVLSYKLSLISDNASQSQRGFFRSFSYPLQPSQGLVVRDRKNIDFSNSHSQMILVVIRCVLSFSQNSPSIRPSLH